MEQERNVPGADAPKRLGAATWIGHEGQDATFMWPYMFSLLADEYDRRYGLNDAHLHAIAELNMRNAKDNPLAQTRGWTFGSGGFAGDDRDNPVVEGRLRRTDCAQVTDGVAGVLLVSDRYKAERLGGKPLARTAGWGHGTAALAENPSASTRADGWGAYSTTAPYLHYGVVDAGHHLVHYVPVDLPGPRLPHDMAFTEQDLSEACTEFGTINSGFGGRPYRYTYAATNEPGWFLFNGLVKHDTLTGREESYQFEPGVFCSEVGVAPRAGGTGEDDAYLVTLTVDENRDLSECVVFRASDVGRGPIARAQLPERIASGTHSCWAPGDCLRGWA